MTLVIFAICVLFSLVTALTIALLALNSQVAGLLERALPADGGGGNARLQIGDQPRPFTLPSLTGGVVWLGPKLNKATLILFLSPSCWSSRRLLSELHSIRASDGRWLDLVLAGEGQRAQHERLIRREELGTYPYVVSRELRFAYQVTREPFAVLLDRHGTILAAEHIEKRKQLRDLLSRRDVNVVPIQPYRGRRSDFEQCPAP